MIDASKYDFSMEIFHDKNDKIRWRIVREERGTGRREIEVSGQCTFETVDEAQDHCCFYLGDKWRVEVVEE